MANTTGETHVIRGTGTVHPNAVDENSETYSVFVTGLKNAHAMENQALSIMRPQLKRIDNYPEMARRLEQHITETEGQLERLEQILDAHEEDKSGLKDMAMSMAGGMGAIGHAMAGDEILKDSMANYAFEHYEIAAYKSLITVAKAAGGTSAISLLQQNLDEEERMAEWIDQNLDAVTKKYLSLREAGETAKH
ncbi:MAG TPA: ferritin-like domain-containing protein [Devosiaceae bacterium]|jgi:ferritin-like metal-binding protein YciE|nr:ferritin-like domain-containing protein [Devosiaceae bacterium]